MNDFRYPDGCTQTDHDRAFDIDDNEEQRVREELAHEELELMTETAREFLQDNASDYIVGLMRGGDHAVAAMRNARGDCLAYLAENMDSARVRERREDA